MTNEVLAESYGVSVEQFKALLGLFSQQRTHQHFADFLRALITEAEKANA